jgi:hypothetical protein
MKKLILLPILFFAYQNLYAQSFNCTGLAANRYYLKDTIVVNCDTVFLLNKTTYTFYRNQVKKISTTDPKLKEFLLSQAQLINLYEHRIVDTQKQYAELRKSYDENLTKSSLLIENSNADLTKIKSSLTKAQNNVTAAQDSIAIVKSVLVKEKARIKKNNLKWGAGGVILGVLATLVLGGR